jgi:hypothetical protein
MNRTLMTMMVSMAPVLTLSSGCGHQDGATATGANADPAAAVANAANVAAQAPAPAAKADTAILDVCSLVSLADAESILGTPAKLSEHQADDKQSSSCNYGSASETHGVNGLMVEIHTDEDAAEARADFAIQKQLWSSAEALPGIGDAALLSVNEQPNVGEDAPAAAVAMLPDQQILIAIKGARKIQITTNYFGRPRGTDSLKALANKLASNI